MEHTNEANLCGRDGGEGRGVERDVKMCFTQLCVFKQTGNTALHRAAVRGHIEIVKVLLECDADVDLKNEVHD